MKAIHALTQTGALAAILQAGRSRYRHFLHSAVDTATLWGLHDGDGWVSLSDAHGGRQLPVWPSAVCARLCVHGACERGVPARIDLQDFLRIWLPDMDALDVGVDVFSTPLRAGFVVSARQCRAHLQACLADRHWKPPGDAGWPDFPSHPGAS